MNDSLRRLRLPLYLAAVVLLVIAITDIITVNLPMAPGSMTWRYASTGNSSLLYPSIIIVSIIVAVLAADGGRPVTLRVLGALNGVVAALLLVIGLSYLLDTLQLRNQVPNDQVLMESFRIGSAKTLGKTIVTAVTLGAVAWGLFRTARSVARAEGGSRSSTARLMREE